MKPPEDHEDVEQALRWFTPFWLVPLLLLSGSVWWRCDAERDYSKMTPNSECYWRCVDAGNTPALCEELFDMNGADIPENAFCREMGWLRL